MTLLQRDTVRILRERLAELGGPIAPQAELKFGGGISWA